MLVGLACVLAAGASADSVRFDPAPDSVVLRFTETYGELVGASSTLVIYGDGTLTVTHPSSMHAPNPGPTKLSTTQLQGLLEELVRRRLPDLEVGQLRSQMRAMDATESPKANLFVTFDASTIELWFSFDVGPDAGPLLPIKRSLRWHGLRADARRYHGLAPLQDFEAVRRELTALMMNEATGAPLP
jgi:hypothetical protein